MARMAAMLIFVGCIAAFLVVLFWYGLRREPNRDPAIGTNSPYPAGPTGAGADVPPYLPTFTVSDAETFRRGADRRLTRIFRQPRVKARSWMDEPGALEAAGLVDAPAPADPDPGTLVAAHSHRHRKRR